MAVDTRLKRGSILGLTLASLVVLPDADASVNDADRVNLAYSYAGTDFSGITGTIANTIDGFSQSATGVAETGGAVTNTIDGFSQSATGVVKTAGTIANTIDGFSQSATGTIKTVGTANNTINGFSQSATGTGGVDAASQSGASRLARSVDTQGLLDAINTPRQPKRGTPADARPVPKPADAAPPPATEQPPAPADDPVPTDVVTTDDEPGIATIEQFLQAQEALDDDQELTYRLRYQANLDRLEDESRRLQAAAVFLYLAAE